MSQITTCPSCGTRFRVVADQLRISDGWVRCGQCQEVFDARNYLDAIAPVTPPRPESPLVAVLPSAPVVPSLPVAVADTAAPPPAASHVQPPVRPPIPMIPVPAPRAPAAPEAAAPGYELPAPTWADDFDFSTYQAPHGTPAGQPVPETVPPENGVPRAPGSVAPIASDEGASAGSDVLQPDRMWRAALDATPASAAQARSAPAIPASEEYQALPPSAADARAEPAWEPESPAHVAAGKSDFPPLDLSVLPEPALAVASAPPVSASDAAPVSQVDLDENGSSSSLHQYEKLSKDERLSFDASTAAAPPVSEAVDAIESAAQKLAQAELPAAAPAAAPVGESSAPAPFPFAPHAQEDSTALDSSLEPGFVRDARRKAWWQKPMVRVAMGAGVVVLPVALALQVALHERNALAAWKPSLRPGLEFMCTALQCKLGPRQQTGAMVVSGSAFAKGELDRSYLLNLSIQNRARTPMGVPAVELTLTDAQDQAIARKVIAAKDLGAPQELAAGAEWSGAVPVTTQGLNLQVVGYRVLLFYP